MTHDSFRLLDTGPLSAAENMALDEVIPEEAATRHSRPTLRFLPVSPVGNRRGFRNHPGFRDRGILTSRLELRYLFVLRKI